MKKITIFSIATLLLASCQVINFGEEEEENFPEKGEKTMHFRLTTYSMSNLDEQPNNDNDGIVADGRNATRATVQDATDHLLLGIYDAKGNLVDTIVYQNKNDATLPAYGTFTHTLKFGKYTVLALGWNGMQKCTVHRPDSISFSEGWAPHTFLCRQNVVVSESYSDTRSLSLKRCVAKFTITLKDKAKPQELSDFVFRFSGAGSALNSETRHCAQESEFTRTIAVPDPSKANAVTSYCFLPADSAGISVNVAAHDADGNVLAEKTFDDVPMKINYDTRYSGYFFAIGSLNGNITFDTTYDGKIEMDF